jgi:DNA polymerase
MFHVPIESVKKGSPLRQKAKQAELACIAEGQMVLTDKGLVPIEAVTLEHRLWDGLSWVSHDGVVYKGEGEVIEYDGLTATKDHLVWVEGQPQPVQFRVAAASGAHLLQTGDGGRAVRMGGNNQSRETLEQEMEPLLCANPLYGLWQCAVAVPGQFTKRQIKWVSILHASKTNPKVAGSKAYRRKTALRKSRRSFVPKLWGARHSVLFWLGYKSWGMDTSERKKRPARLRTRPDRQQWKLRARKYPFCPKICESGQSPCNCYFVFPPKILAIPSQCCYKAAIQWPKTQADNCPCGGRCYEPQKKLAAHIGKARLYDIRNAGRYHRFTVSGKLVHNCGYGGSVGALKAMGALEMGLQEDELQGLVNAWRATNPNIVKLWWDVDRAVTKAVRDKTTTEAHGIRFSYQSAMLFITLPSGRKLSYVKPRIGTNKFGSSCITYMGTGATKKWERIESYGPKFVENIVQAISRDILCYAMRTFEHCSVVMHIHDELVMEAEPNMSLEVVCEQMSRTPPWAEGLILRADGYVCDFYQKD